MKKARKKKEVRAVDLFAGAGGFTTGALAAGARVVLAANHWLRSVEVHSANHPRSRALLPGPTAGGLRGLPGPRAAARRRRPVRATAPPASRAGGGLVPCPRPTRPTATPPGRSSLARRPRGRGRSWSRTSPRSTGGSSTRTGAGALRRSATPSRSTPSTRPTSGCRRTGSARSSRRGWAPLWELANPGLPHAAFGPHVDWSAGDWAPVESKPAGARRRVEAGRARGIGERFITHYGWSGHKGRELDRPIGTITTKVHWGVVDGARMRMLTIDEHRLAMGFPEDYELPATKVEAVRMLGNAIAPRFAEAVCRQALAA